MLKSILKKYLAQEIVTKGAIGAYQQIGKGDKQIADKFAVDNIREFLKKQNFATIYTKTGEGELDESAMINIDEVLGNGMFEFDIAIDPLDCTTACSKGMEGSISAVCIGDKDSILNCPDIYMEKLSSCSIPEGVISLDNTFAENIEIVAKFKNKKIEDVSVIMLERERHLNVINIARKNNIKINFIKDGDIMSILKTHFEDIDFYYGIGGAPEGVISASAAMGLGGFFEGKFVFEDDAQRERSLNMKINENKIYTARDLVGDSSVFAVCAVTNNSYLKGVKVKEKNTKNFIQTNTLIIDCKNKTIEKIKGKNFI